MQKIGLLLALAAGAAFAAAQSEDARGDEPAPRAQVRRSSTRVWDPYLARYRDEKPGQVWDPWLARYRDERPGRVWDPYLARNRDQGPSVDPAGAYDRQADGRHRHPGRDGWCTARH